MLPSINRLTKKKDFDAIFKNGISVKKGFLVVKAVKTGLAVSRFGIVVSKKVSNKATTRNKIRRQLRDIIGSQLPVIKKPFDVALVGLPGIEKETFSDMGAMVSGSFKKLGII
jgi:ribonuclease P protein component